MKVSENNKKELHNEPVDLLSLLSEFQEEYRNVFIKQIDNDVFIYRSLGRSEYKRLLMEEDIDPYTKQDIICEVCTLWPKDFDFSSCNAGLPSVLHKEIITNSYLDSLESRQNVLSYYRSEMYALENQIACIIHEAFPDLDIEEIEAWDTEKTMKYLSRAEWILTNLRGIPFVDNPNVGESFYPAKEEPEQDKKEQTEEKETTRRGPEKIPLTPEKIAEMKELQRKFPEINFFGDTIINEGMSGMVDDYDAVAPALRPGFGLK